MSELDDAQEFAEAVSRPSAQREAKLHGALDKTQATPSKAEPGPESVPGTVSQYALYAGGYAATTPTVSSLPSGRYDIDFDNRNVYAIPALKPSGLLLDLPEMRSNYVIELVERFLNSEKDYKEGNEFIVGGAAFKAGIMIFGPPGSGKSCTIKIVSNKLIERGGTVFYCSNNPSIIMRFLTDFAKIEQNRKSIVILEDIDNLIANYGESGYLEMLDSAKTINNVLFIATTNYPEHLDPRVYNRPGRFSHVVKIGLPGPNTRDAYLRAILKNHRDVDEIVSKTDGFTIDHLTALVNSIYREKKDLCKEIDRLRTLFRVPKSSGVALGINTKNEWDNNE
jgi:predicted AAA+ superfamily ATPase